MVKMLRETRTPPAGLPDRVAQAGGWNYLGEPNFRVVWGWNRLTWVGGKWEDRDDQGNLIREVFEYRLLPKYPDLDRWHLEKWMAPSFYGSPQSWEVWTREVDGPYTFAALGPYPNRGEYEHVTTVQGPNGEPVDLTPGMCEYIIRAVERCRYLLPADRRRGIEQREEKKLREEDSFAENVLAAAGPAFHGRPFIVVPTFSETLKLSQRSN